MDAIRAVVKQGFMKTREPSKSLKTAMRANQEKPYMCAKGKEEAEVLREEDE